MVVSVVDDVIKWAREQVPSRVPRADLDQRDPDCIRGGVIEFVEFEPARDLARLSTTGVSARGCFHLRDAGSGDTKVTFRLAYPSPDGLLSVLASRQVGQTLITSLDNLRSIVESEGAQWDSPSRSPDPPAR